MYGIYEEVQEGDIYMVTFRMKNGVFKEKVDVEIGFINYKIRINV